MTSQTTSAASTSSGPRPPILELVGPDGRRLAVAPRSGADLVGELADAIAAASGCTATRDLTIDGEPVARHVTLAGAGVVRGSRIGWREPPICSPAGPPMAVVTCVAGPGSSCDMALPPGRHVVGRGRHVPLLVDDDAIEPQHGVLDVTAEGAVTFTQLAGRTPCRIEGVALAGTTALPDGTTLQLGASRVRISTAPTPEEPETGAASGAAQAALSPSPGDPWRRSLWRTPRQLPRWEPEPVAVPSAQVERARSAGIGIASAAIGAVGAAALSLLLGQPMFLLFGLLGLFVAGGTWLGGRYGTARDRRTAGERHRREVDAFRRDLEAQTEARRRHHLETTPTVNDAIGAAWRSSGELWVRRGDHPDAFAATLGWGPVSWVPSVADGEPPAELLALVAGSETLADVPVAIDLCSGAALAVVGSNAAPVVRSIIVQLAAFTGPADWRLLLVVDDPDSWDWCRWLPHTALEGDSLVLDADRPDHIAATLERLGEGDARHVVLITDRADLLTARTGCLRRYLGTTASAAVVVQAPSTDRVPALCRSVIQVGSLGAGRLIVDASTTGAAEHLHVAGVSTDTATDAARRLARLRDPEDDGTDASSLSATVTLGALVARHGVGPIDDAIAVAAAWRSNGSDPPPAAVIGITGDGVVELDLVRDGPHALIAGTTGSGKSELLRTMVVSLAARSSPEHLTFVLVDYKGGSTFDCCADLPHTVGLVTDLDDRSAERALVSLGAELRRRERLMREAAVADLAAYRAVVEDAPLPRLVVVIDEFAALTAELPSFLSALVGIAQRGRSLGVHLVLATQRPAGVVSDEIRANTNLRIALRLHDVAEARDVVGDPLPATFARGASGRAMMRLGPGETVTFQTARSSGPMAARDDDQLRVVTRADGDDPSDVTELTVLVRAIRHAAALCDIARPHRPWLPPLPSPLTREAMNDLDDGAAVGLVDDPTAQSRRALRWTPADGNLALIGGRGTGTTTAVLSVLAARSRSCNASALHLYVVDAFGDRRFDAVEALPHCGAVVRLHETERLSRVLLAMREELDRRRVAAAGQRPRRPQVVLAVDGLPALRAALDGAAAAAELDALLRFVTEGPGVDMACVLTAERPGAIAPSLLAACAERWVFHLDDRTESATVGLPSALVPARIAGRLVVASSRLEAQIAEGPHGGGTDPAPATGGPTAITVLPSDVDERLIGRSWHGAGGELHLAVGLDFRSLATAHLTTPDGEHVLVAGPARSGRSTALARLACSWRDAHPGGTALLVRDATARPVAGLERLTLVSAESAAARAGTDAPLLVVIDDAERVDDPAGELATLVSSRRPGLLVVTAGRPEALRSLYGHWTTIVRRSRLGLLMSACADADGDVLGEVLPRHPPLRPRPGLAWVVSNGDRHLVQIARRF